MGRDWQRALPGDSRDKVRAMMRPTLWPGQNPDDPHNFVGDQSRSHTFFVNHRLTDSYARVLS
jgi:hypothetical protein